MPLLAQSALESGILLGPVLPHSRARARRAELALARLMHEFTPVT